MKPADAPRISFGSTSVASLISAVRATADPAVSVDWEQLETSVATQVEQLIEANRQFVQDSPSEQWLRTSSVVLATYQALRPYIDGPQLLSVFLNAMAVPFRAGIAGYLESRFGIARDAPQEAFSRITENFQKRGEERFGAAFRYVADVRDTRRNFVNIERCFFNDFFRANQAREVTSLFCALDKVWAESLEQRPYAVRFERPTTLANGDDACRFQFHKIDPD